MKNMNKSIGDYGEDIVCNYLSLQNHTILFRNFRKRNGELDIISRLDDIIIFTEVKTRYSKLFGEPMESVNSHKQATIKTLAKYFIHTNNLYDYYIRFDVAEVFLNYENESFNINHITDAFR